MVKIALLFRIKCICVYIYIYLDTICMYRLYRYAFHIYIYITFIQMHIIYASKALLQFFFKASESFVNLLSNHRQSFGMP